MIFVVGAPRSGTTLLQNLLASSPGAGSGPETHFMVHATPVLLYERNLPPVGKRALPERLSRAAAERLLGHLADGEKAAAAERVRAGLGAGPVRLAELADRYFKALAAAGCSEFIEKSPPHVFYIPEILSLFPGARIVHIVRDPRDVVASINRMLVEMGKYPRGIVERACVWNGSIDAARGGPVFTVRYEDLVTRPRECLEAVFDHVGLRFDPACLEGHAASAGGTVMRKETWKRGNFEPLSPRSIGRYRDSLTGAETGLVERLCAVNMREHGYEPTGAGCPAAAARKEILRFRLWRARRICRAVVRRAGSDHVAAAASAPEAGFGRSSSSEVNCSS